MYCNNAVTIIIINLITIMIVMEIILRIIRKFLISFLIKLIVPPFRRGAGVMWAEGCHIVVSP